MERNKNETRFLLEPPFGPILKQLRKHKGLTKRQVAKAMHVSRQYISKLERKNSNPTFRVFTRYLSAAGYTLKAVKLVPAGQEPAII